MLPCLSASSHARPSSESLTRTRSVDRFRPETSVIKRNLYHKVKCHMRALEAMRGRNDKVLGQMPECLSLSGTRVRVHRSTPT